MALLITSLHKDYQPHLDILWALRELCSNAIDGEERHRHLGIGAMSVDYSSRSKTLTLRNEGVTVSASALLMGKSDSRGDDRCIGQFGEGLPMALNILAREHADVTILNGSEKWTPCIERSSEYDNAPVLAVKVRSLPKAHPCFQVTVKGIDHALYQAFLGLYLKMDDRFDPTMTVEAGDVDEFILLQPHYKGCVYNKGVFVEKRKDLWFGYNISGELNRDRSLMDTEALSKRLHNLLSDACYSSDKFVEMVSRILVEANGVLEVDREYSEMTWNTPLREKVCDLFVERYGENAVAVTSESEANEASTIGLVGIRCSSVLREIVSRNLGSLADRKKKRDRMASPVAVEELGSVERTNFNIGVRLIQAVVPEARSITFVACRFQADDVRYSVSDDVIHVAIREMLSFDRTVLSVVMAVVESRKLYGETNNILARMISQLVTGEGSASLALTLLGET
jgi:hypothetical protein